MPRFFYQGTAADALMLAGEDAKHIGRVLRMKPGEALTVACTDGMDCDCVIRAITAERVELTVEKCYPNESEPSLSLTLYQAMPKGDKLDLIVQKAVELGVSRIVPVLTKRCVSRPDAKAMVKKVERLQKIALEAAKQSGRGIIPQVGELLSFRQVLGQAAKHERMILCYENGGQPLNALVDEAAKDIGLLIGSEGGFEEEEARQAQDAGMALATLGKRILRCETAPLAAAAIIMNLTRNI